MSTQLDDTRRARSIAENALANERELHAATKAELLRAQQGLEMLRELGRHFRNERSLRQRLEDFSR